MTQTFNPSRLDVARRRRGLTKIALSEATGLSLSAIVAYGGQARTPKPAAVKRLSEALLFPTGFFYGPTLEEPPIQGSSFRALSTLTARLRDKAIAAGTLALALSDWINARFELPEVTIPRISDIDPETAAVAVRGEWGRGELPIKNMIHLLEGHGVRVFSLTEETAELDAFSFWRDKTPYIFLNTMKSAERSRMDAAHELGHLVLHWKGGTGGRKTEREADQFGSAFLMPRGSVIAEAPRGARLDQIVETKRHWNVSVANLTYRMNRLGLLSEWQYRRLFMEMGKRRYRRKEPNPSPSETSKLLAKVFGALRENGVTRSQIAEQLNIFPDELDKAVFGLVLTSVKGTG